MRTRCITFAWMCLMAAGAAWAGDDHHHHHGPAAAASPAAQRLREALLKELDKGNLDGAVEMALKAASGTQSPDIHNECLSLLSSIARQSLRNKDYLTADKAISVMRRFAPDDPAVLAMSKSIANARDALPARLQEAKHLLTMEWYEPAFQTLAEAVALAPDRRKELTDDYFHAAVGVGDDHYFTKNFRDAFYGYDTAIQLRLGDGKPVSASLSTRWLQSMVLALLDDVDRATFTPDFWRMVLQRVASAPPAVTGDAKLRAMIRGLAAEDGGDARQAAREFALVAGIGGDPMDKSMSAAAVRAEAVKQLRRLYDPELSDRRAGVWRKQKSGDWRLLEAPGFRIRHRNEQVARAVAEALAFHFDRICVMLGKKRAQVAWPVACEVWLYPDKQQYAKAVNPKADAVLALSDIRLRGGKLESHAIHATQSDPMLLSSTLAHELTHLIVGAATDYRSLPGALAEGVALAAEPRGRHVQFARLYRGLAKRRTAAALLQFNEAHPTDAAFYAEAANLVTRLSARGGLAPILALPDRPTPDDVVKAYKLTGLPELERTISPVASAPAARRD